MTVDRTDRGAGATGRWPLLLCALATLALLVVVAMWIGGRAAEDASASPEGATATSGVEERTVASPAETDVEPTPADDASATTDAHLEQISQAAGEDADALAAALAEVKRAAAELDQAVAVSRAHHEQIALPVRDLVLAHSEEFNQDVADVLQSTVELSVEAVDALDDEDAARSQAGIVALPHLSGDATDPAPALEAHYRPLSAEELADARTQITQEVARLMSLAEDQQEATLKVRAALQSVDETIYAALTVAEGTGSETAQALTHSSDEASTAFTLAIDRISELTAVEVHEASWEQRSVERPSVLGDAADPDEISQGGRTPSVVETLEIYLETARAARASHALHAADPVDEDPDPEPAGDPGGSGGGGAGYACYKWGLYGGYVGWCY